jgi:hypothetical protein
MPAPHRPPRPPKTDPKVLQENRRDNAITEAMEAFGALCDALTEAVEILTEELKEERK